MLGYIFLHNNTSHQTPQQSRSFPVWEEVNRNTSAEPSGLPLTWCKARRLGGTPGGWHIRCRPGRCRWPECGSLPSWSAPPTEQEHKVEMSWRFNNQDRLRGRYWPQRSRGPSPGRRCSFLHGPPDPGSRWTPQAFSTGATLKKNQERGKITQHGEAVILLARRCSMRAFTIFSFATWDFEMLIGCFWL